MGTMNKSVNIVSQNLEAAGFKQRLKAFGFDYIPISAYIIVLFGVSMGVIKAVDYLGQPISWPENVLLSDAIAFATLILPVALYFTLQESSPHQASWGKRKVGLRVVAANGGTLTRKRAFVRSLLKLLPWQIAHTSIFHIEGWPLEAAEPTPWVTAGFVLVWVLVGIYFLTALFTKEHRTPYDWVAGSYVVFQNKKSPKGG